MPLTINEARSSFSASGPDWEPVRDDDWARATDAERRDYYRHLGGLLVTAKRRELRRGLDAAGNRLDRIKQARPDGADGPPLSPHRAASRFQRYCRVATTNRSATVYWGSGWSKVVGGHRSGRACGVVRDVVGLSPASQRWVKEQARLRWRNRHGQPPPPPAPSIAPRPSPRPFVPRVELVAAGRRVPAFSTRVRVFDERPSFLR